MLSTYPQKLKNQIENEIFSFAFEQDVLYLGGDLLNCFTHQKFDVTFADCSLRGWEQVPLGSPHCLKIDDPSHLPYKNNSFTKIICYNVYSKNLSDVLYEWYRVIKPGGYLIFNWGSLDHAHLSGQFTLPPTFSWSHPLFASFQEVAQIAGHLGLTIRRVNPYGFFFGRHHNLLLTSLESTFWWGRIIDISNYDNQLYEFIYFMERYLIQPLTYLASGVSLVVLEKNNSEDSNRDYLEKIEDLNQKLKEEISLNTLKTYLYPHCGSFYRQLNQFLAYPRNVAFLYFLWSHVHRAIPQLNLASFLTESHNQTLAKLLSLQKSEDEIECILTGLRSSCSTYTYKGVNIPSCVETRTGRNLVQFYLEENSHP